MPYQTLGRFFLQPTQWPLRHLVHRPRSQQHPRLPAVPRAPLTWQQSSTGKELVYSPASGSELKRAISSLPALPKMMAPRGCAAEHRGVHFTPGPPISIATSSVSPPSTRSGRRQQQHSAQAMASSITTWVGNRASNRPATANRCEASQCGLLQSPASISSAHAGIRPHVIEIPDSPTDDNGAVPWPSPLPPPPYTSTPSPAASTSCPPFAPTEPVDPNILVVLDLLDLDEDSRSLVLRCVSCTPGYPQNEWEGILEHGGLSQHQIETLLPFMNEDYYDNF